MFKLTSQKITQALIDTIESILHAMVCLPTQQHWSAARTLFINWIKFEKKITDSKFIETYVPQVCNYGQAGHLPGQPISTQGMERSFRTLKAEKNSVLSFPKYSGDLFQTVKSISNHKVHNMQRKVFQAKPYHNPNEWDVLRECLFQHAKESCHCAVYYNNKRSGEIVRRKDFKNCSIMGKTLLCTY